MVQTLDDVEVTPEVNSSSKMQVYHKLVEVLSVLDGKVPECIVLELVEPEGDRSLHDASALHDVVNGVEESGSLSLSILMGADILSEEVDAICTLVAVSRVFAAVLVVGHWEGVSQLAAELVISLHSYVEESH